MTQNEEYEEQENQQDDSSDYIEEEYGKKSENIDNKISASDFDPAIVIYDIKKILNGYEKRNGIYVRVTLPLVCSGFIAIYETSLRGLLSFHNMFSQITIREASMSMMEGLKEITYVCVDFGVKEEHIETLVNTYDTLKNTFYGIMIDGRGTENIKQVLTAVYQNLMNAQNPTKNTAVNWEYIQNMISK